MMNKILLFLALVSLSFSAFTQDVASLRKEHFNLDKGIAILGYDPVAYFASNKAVKGSKNLAVFHQGVIYQFSSEANKALFRANPVKYEPEYGGWCAYAMGNSGEQVSVDPETYKIVAGKLYLFYNKFFTNTLKEWNKNETTLRKNADLSWPKLIR